MPHSGSGFSVEGGGAEHAANMSPDGLEFGQSNKMNTNVYVFKMKIKNDLK